MQVTRTQLNAMFTEAGYNPANWTDKRLKDKVSALPKLMDEVEDKLNGDNLKLARSLVKSVQANEAVEIVKEGDAAVPSAAAQPATNSAPSASGAAGSTEAAPKAEGTGKAQKGVRPPGKAESADGKGVIGTIVDELNKTSESSPITKKRMVEILVAKFPTRTAEAMSKTVAVQLPNRLRKDKKLNIQKNANGYYLVAGEPAAQPAAAPAAESKAG